MTFVPPRALATPVLRLQPIRHLVLIGGGVLLTRVALMSRARGLEVSVVTAPRHSVERVDGDVPLADWLEQNAISHQVIERLSTWAFQPDDATAVLSFGAAWVLPRALLERFGGRVFNVHGARLPHDRGAGGFSWQIMRNHRFGYCLLHQVDDGVDSGPVLWSQEYLFPASCRIPVDFMDEALKRNEAFLAQCLGRLMEGGEIILQPQREEFSVYWPRISTQDQGYVDWSWTAREIELFICALDEPYIGAGTFLRGEEVRLRGAWASGEEHEFHPFQAGLVFRKSDLGVYVATRTGTLLIREMRDAAGDSVMNTVRLGDRLDTPASVLDQVRASRVVYDPNGRQRPKTS